jgi:hypothetical protein
MRYGNGIVIFFKKNGIVIKDPLVAYQELSEIKLGQSMPR